MFVSVLRTRFEIFCRLEHKTNTTTSLAAGRFPEENLQELLLLSVCKACISDDATSLIRSKHLMGCLCLDNGDFTAKKGTQMQAVI